MRYLTTSTGRKLHIVRELSYPIGDTKLALCGAWPAKIAGKPAYVSSPPAPEKAPICKSCSRLAKTL